MRAASGFLGTPSTHPGSLVAKFGEPEFFFRFGHKSVGRDRSTKMAKNRRTATALFQIFQIPERYRQMLLWCCLTLCWRCGDGARASHSTAWPFVIDATHFFAFLVKRVISWENPEFCRKSPKVHILGARSHNLARSARTPTHNTVSDRVAALVPGGITTFLASRVGPPGQK